MELDLDALQQLPAEEALAETVCRWSCCTSCHGTAS
ncbi:ALQxL family class IV lanthipeptide [Streptomyces sp. NPDC097981]